MAGGNSNGPLSGYQCSNFGKASARRLRLAEAKGCATVRGRPRKKLKQSDIIFFSGHHYARYDQPLFFDAIDLNDYKIKALKVRLIMVSSCAGLRKNARVRFKRKFPNAYIFGWITSSPLNQKGMMYKFIEGVNSKIDIGSEKGMEELIKKWRSYIENLASDRKSVSPYGLGYATPQGGVSYYIRDKGAWKWVNVGGRSKK